MPTYAEINENGNLINICANRPETRNTTNAIVKLKHHPQFEDINPDGSWEPVPLRYDPETELAVLDEDAWNAEKEQERKAEIVYLVRHKKDILDAQEAYDLDYSDDLAKLEARPNRTDYLRERPEEIKMPYKPFRSVGARKFTSLSGSGTLEAVGNTTIGGTFNVTGALTFSAVDSGSLAGGDSQLALNSAGVVVIDATSMNLGPPIGCYFSSSDSGDSGGQTLTLYPALGSAIDNIATIPISDGSSVINLDVSSNLTVDIGVSGSGGLDSGDIDSDTVLYYVYLLTDAGGTNPALILSQNGVSPTGSTDYTFKSQAIFCVYRNTTWNLWQKFSADSEGWMYCNKTLASSLYFH